MNKLLTVISAAALLAVIAGPVFADHNQKTVFITSAKFKGNLGGLTGADDKCQAEADGPASIVPSGIYLAWLSDGTDSPDIRFTKSSHPRTSGKPYLWGTIAFTFLSNLLSFSAAGDAFRAISVNISREDNHDSF